MSRVDAEGLAATAGMSDDLLAFAIDRADETKPKHRGRYIAKLLTTPPAAQDGFDRYRADRFAKQQRRYADLLHHAKKRASGPDGGVITRDAELIRSVWPTGPDLVGSGVIVDADFVVPDTDWAALFDRLALAARAQGRRITNLEDVP